MTNLNHDQREIALGLIHGQFPERHAYRNYLALGARTAALTAKAMLGYGAVKSAEDHLAVWEYLDRRASLLDRYRTDRLLARTAAHYATKELR